MKYYFKLGKYFHSILKHTIYDINFNEAMNLVIFTNSDCIFIVLIINRDKISVSWQLKFFGYI